jgi:hypothetical protein
MGAALMRTAHLLSDRDIDVEIFVPYAKAVIAGFAAALLACVIWVAATFVLPLMLPMVIERLSPATVGGVGMSVAYISIGPLVLIAIIAFAAGFTWRLRKHRRASRREIG